MGMLYRFEVKGIQDFILSTNKLKEIKGGSRLIKAFAEIFHDIVQAYPCNLLTNAAGGATVVFENDDDTREVMEIWSLTVHHLAPELQLIQAFVPWEDHAPLPYAALQAQLQKSRSQLRPILPEGTPISYRSPSTGLIAEQLHTLLGESLTLDRGALHRLKLGTDSKGDELGNSVDDEVTWAVNLEKDMPHGRVSVVHIDGNDLGVRLQKLTSSSQDLELSTRLSQFSKTLSETTLQSAREAFAVIKAVALDEGIWTKDKAFPARFIVIGGDDVTLMIDSRLGHRFIEHYLRAFEKLSAQQKEILGGELTACAGLVEVKSSWPFNQACELAESLCSFCKSHLRGRLNTQTPSALAWHRVTTSMVGDFEQEVLHRELLGAGHVSLNAGPYTLRQVDGFITIEQIRTLSEALCSSQLPQGPLRQCLSYLKTDLRLAEDRWQRVKEISVSGNKKARKEAWEIVQLAMHAMLGEASDSLVFQGHSRGSVAPLSDAYNLSKAERSSR